MKAIIVFGLGLSLAGAGAASAGQFPAVRVHGEPARSLAISCTRPALPSQRLVGEVLQVDNLDQTYRLRSQVMAVAARACKAGAAQVLVQRSDRGQLGWLAKR